MNETARADRDNAVEPRVVGGSAAVPGPEMVTLTRPLCVDDELSLTESETRTGRFA